MPSGRFLGNGRAVTCFLGYDFWEVASEDDELSTASALPRPWNLAKRLKTEIFSNSWHSPLISKIETLLSNLQDHKGNKHLDTQVFKQTGGVD